MRKSAGKIFAIQFVKSLLFIVLFIGIIIVSYRAIMHYYGIGEDHVTSTISPVTNQPSSVLASRIDDVSKHLIFCADEETGDVKKVVLEIFNCEAHRMVYITIPIKTQFILSDSLYRELVLIKPSIPQFLKISAIPGYFSKESIYEYSVLMIEDFLDIEISYYSVVPESLYVTVFETGYLEHSDKSLQDSDMAYMGEMFSHDFLEFIHTIKTETDLRNYIEDVYTQIESNLTLEDKFNYLESYLYLPDKNISFEIIAGEDSNRGYIVDKSMARKQIEDYINE